MSKEEFIDKVLPLRAKLVSYAQSFLNNKDETEDVVQEVYIKLWCMRQRLHEYKSIDALSFVITKNICLNKIRINNRLVSVDQIGDLDIDSIRPDRYLTEKDDLEKTLQLIKELPTLQQAILKMRHLEELEISEIAELTGCNEGAVRTNLSRARSKIRTLFMEIQNYEK